MGDTRFVYGLAYGKQNNFYTLWQNKTHGLLAQGSATPDVTVGNLFYTNNSAATTITDFGLSHPSSGAGNVAGLFEGKKITVWFLDTNTRLAASTRLVTAGSDGAQGANTIVEFLYHNSAWVEINRSRPGTDQITVTSASLGVTGVFDATGKKVVNTFASAGSAITLRRALGGEQGQVLTILNGGSSLTLVVNSGGADTFVSSSSTGAATMVIVGSGAFQFVRAGAQWWEVRNAGVAVNAL